ncbi:MAG: hypothetical protein OEM22_05750 [Acidimicrobiia bacterium]|nr:hypothetical protein [Acidimicrobiia bacterium]MDH3470783.1 hypothetical protein [Acidimicrobiia bacterium]
MARITLLALVLLVAACTPSPLDAEPAEIDTCEDIATATVGVLQDQLDLVATLSLEQVLADPGPPELEALELRGDELAARSTAIGCGDAEIGVLIKDRSQGLVAEGPVAERFLDAIRDRIGP